MRTLFEPGFFTSAPVHVALVIGAVTATVSAVVGVFTVIRGQSFAGHALTDVATTGGSGAFYLGINPLLGFIGGGVIGAGAMDLVGVQRMRSRDMATGVVLGTASGVAALFLYLDTTRSATTGATQQILFGSIFTVDSSTIPLVVLLSVLTLAVIGLIQRPLLLSSFSVELARVRGINARAMGLMFLIAMAVSVGLSSIAVGSILSTALLIGPAATAVRLVTHLRAALILASVIGVVTAWLGILFAYDSYYWIPSTQGLPVSFFIVGLIFVAYLGSGRSVVHRTLARLRRSGRPGTTEAQPIGVSH